MQEYPRGLSQQNVVNSTYLFLIRATSRTIRSSKSVADKTIINHKFWLAQLLSDFDASFADDKFCVASICLIVLVGVGGTNPTSSNSVFLLQLEHPGKHSDSLLSLGRQAPLEHPLLQCWITFTDVEFEQLEQLVPALLHLNSR
jgi:hypothetical protein